MRLSRYIHAHAASRRNNNGVPTAAAIPGVEIRLCVEAAVFAGKSGVVIVVLFGRVVVKLKGMFEAEVGEPRVNDGE